VLCFVYACMSHLLYLVIKHKTFVRLFRSFPPFHPCTSKTQPHPTKSLPLCFPLPFLLLLLLPLKKLPPLDGAGGLGGGVRHVFSVVVDHAAVFVFFVCLRLGMGCAMKGKGGMV
jgi:hypothetical protein